MTPQHEHSGEAGPDLVKQLVEHHYMQHLLKEEVEKRTREYWDSRRKWITALISLAVATVAFFGFQLRDVFDLKSMIADVKTQVTAAKAMADQMKKDADTAKGDAEKASGFAKTVQDSVKTIQEATLQSVTASTGMVNSSLQNSNSLITAASNQLAEYQKAGEAYASSAREALANTKDQVKDTRTALDGLVSAVSTGVSEANQASGNAKQALTAAQTFLKDAAAYQAAVEKIEKLQGELARAQTTETVTILGRDKEGTRAGSRPSVRMKIPGMPDSEYQFTFEMKSPRNSLALRAEVRKLPSGTPETLCLDRQKSSDIYGKFYELGSSGYYIRPDFVYQSLFADDFVILRIVAVIPADARAIPLDACPS